MNTLTPDAYYFLESVRYQNARTYTEILKFLVEPQIVVNIDKYYEIIKKKGGPEKKIQLKTIIKYLRKVTGQKYNPSIVRIDKNGKRTEIS